MSEDNITGRIHSFETLGAVDGPGIRFIVFMQGCPLKCKYCHNRDTWEVNGGTKYTVDEVISKLVKGKSLNSQDSEIGLLMVRNNIDYDYRIVGKAKKSINEQYVPFFDSKVDKNLFLELIEFRKEYCKKHNIPACNVFTNKDAENLVNKKPLNKEEFVAVKGFKEKKYELFGLEIIKIFKKG